MDKYKHEKKIILEFTPEEIKLLAYGAVSSDLKERLTKIAYYIDDLSGIGIKKMPMETSIKIFAGNRNYCFDIKTSVDGIKYLVIKELRDKFKAKQIIVFEEHIQTFYKNFKKAVRCMKRSKSRTYDLKQLRRNYPKAYANWDSDEDDRLISLYAHNKTIKEMAYICQRKPSAIRSHLRKLEKRGLL